MNVTGCRDRARSLLLTYSVLTVCLIASISASSAEKTLAVGVAGHAFDHLGNIGDQAEAAAAMYSPIVTAKMNHVDPQVWLSDVLSRIAAHPMHRLDELLLWNWTRTLSIVPAQAA